VASPGLHSSCFPSTGPELRDPSCIFSTHPGLLIYRYCQSWKWRTRNGGTWLECASFDLDTSNLLTFPTTLEWDGDVFVTVLVGKLVRLIFYLEFSDVRHMGQDMSRTGLLLMKTYITISGALLLID